MIRTALRARTALVLASTHLCPRHGVLRSDVYKRDNCEGNDQLQDSRYEGHQRHKGSTEPLKDEPEVHHPNSKDGAHDVILKWDGLG